MIPVPIPERPLSHCHDFQPIEVLLDGVTTVGEGICSPMSVERLQQVIELRNLIERQYGTVTALRVVGESMVAANILPGDVAFFASPYIVPPESGMIVQIKADHYDPIVKLYEDGQLYSMYETGRMIERFVDADEVRICGVMVYQLRDTMARFRRMKDQ